jgi:hypothetical protein
VAGGAEGGMGGVEQGVTPDEKQPDTAQTAVPGEPAPPPEPAAEKQAQRRWRKWVTTRRLTALVGVLGLAFGIWNAVFKDVREKKLAREAVVAELEALADDIRAFVVPRRASRSSAPTFDKETNELFERKFWGRVVGLRDAVQREYRQSDWRLNATPADLDSMGEVAAGLSELADRVRAGRP